MKGKIWVKQKVNPCVHKLLAFIDPPRMVICKAKEDSHHPGCNLVASMSRVLSIYRGGGGVPGDGSWSLGLGKMKDEYLAGSVDEFESKRAIELEERKNQIKNPHLKKSCKWRDPAI